MSRFVIFVLLLLGTLVACSTPLTLNGTFAGMVVSNGFRIGAMAIDVETRGTSLEGAACFVGLDGSSACNFLTGSLTGSDVAFRVGGLRFTGTTNGTWIYTTFRSDDGTVSGYVDFERSTSSASLSHNSAAVDDREVSAFTNALLATP